MGIDFTAASATESSLLARVVAVASALGGMFITALLLGIVSDAVGDYVDDCVEINQCVGSSRRPPRHHRYAIEQTSR